jgi:predicted ABC-type ATPase
MARLRLIAGPNGSGKTTLTHFLRKQYDLNFGYYINADELELWLKRNGRISFRRFGLKITAPQLFEDFFHRHALAQRCGNMSFTIRRNTLYLESSLEQYSYFTALFADFVREQLLESKSSFAFETVRSGADKIALLEKAKQAGYRIYLYFICIDDVFINKDRVENRVQKGGHSVPEDKIEARYYKTLEQLAKAVQFTNRAYFFDNSGTEHRFIAEVTDGREIKFHSLDIPRWLQTYLLNIF